MSKKKEKIEVNFESLKSEYNSNFSKLENFSRELKAQLINLLDRKEITLGFPVQVRVKTWHSLADKFQRLSHLRFEKALDVQDLVGIRITLLFVRDVEKVCHLIRENLTIKEEYNT
jgi:ppGpp synthetase/RelA/SpoT-type nucleotidyltranferase